jgi:hypothetical protein
MWLGYPMVKVNHFFFFLKLGVIHVHLALASGQHGIGSESMSWSFMLMFGLKLYFKKNKILSLG